MNFSNKKWFILPFSSLIPLSVVSCESPFWSSKLEKTANVQDPKRHPNASQNHSNSKVIKPNTKLQTIDINQLWIPTPTDTSNKVIDQDPTTHEIKTYENPIQLRPAEVMVEDNSFFDPGGDTWLEKQFKKSKITEYKVEPKLGNNLVNLKNDQKLELIYKANPGYEFSNGKKETTKEIALQGLSRRIRTGDLFPTYFSATGNSPWKQVNISGDVKTFNNIPYSHISLFYEGATYYSGQIGKNGKVNPKFSKTKTYNDSNKLPGQNFWVELKPNYKNPVDFAGDVVWTATPNKGYWFDGGSSVKIFANFAFSLAWTWG